MSPMHMKLLRSWTFTWKEIALLKWSLVSFGVLAAYYFSNVLFQFLWVWWGFFIAGAVYFLARFVRE